MIEANEPKKPSGIEVPTEKAYRSQRDDYLARKREIEEQEDGEEDE